MKSFVVLAMCIAGAAAASYGYSAPMLKLEAASYGYEAPALKSSDYATKKLIPIVRYKYDDNNYGTFDFDSVSGDGTHITEEGHLKSLNDAESDGPVTVMSGSYSYLGDDGKTYSVTWTADEDGFKPVGEHLPTPPPTPVELTEAFRLAANSGYSGPMDGSYVHEEPMVKSGYGYSSSPVVVKSSTYDAPLIKTQTYEAPAIRVVARY